MTAALPPPGAGRRVRLDWLTALRWVAALVVFAPHINELVLLVPALSHLSDPGDAGVDFFFVLSGFVLAWSTRPSDTVGSFYRRRAARILPLYLLAWLAGLLAGRVLNGSSLAQQLPSLFLVQAWVPRDQIYFAGATVLWSVSCEAFFYLLFPFLIGLLRRLQNQALYAIAGLAMALAVCVPLALHPADNVDDTRYWLIYPFPATRLCEFVIGVCAALLISRAAVIRIPFVPAAAFALIVYVASGWGPLYIQPVAAPVIPVTLLIIAAAQHDIHGGAGAPRWWVRLGEWSFAFYLFQLTIIRLVEHWAHPAGLGARVALSVLLLLVCVGVAALVSELVEKPLERRLRGDGSLPASLGAGVATGRVTDSASGAAKSARSR